jgi:type VI secretion system protein ImpI
MLEVVSVHKASMGANVRRCIAENEAGEFTIGRLESCHWVLPQDYVSRVQAVIRCVNGMYFLERKGSAPLAINDRSRLIESNRIVRLAPGDHILIDDIEILVSELEPGAAPPAAEAPAAAQADVLSALGDPIDVGGAAAGGDVMELLGGGERQTPLREADRQRQALFPEDRSVLDNLMDFGGTPEAARPARTEATPAEDRWWEDSALSKPATPPPRPGRAVPRPGERPEGSAAPAGRPTPASPADPVRASTPLPARRASTAGEVTLDDVLRGAGLDPAQVTMSPEVASQLGEVLRIVVAGTMDVLRARNDIRRELHIPSTMLAARENNPLKFSADVDDALHKLLVQRASAYLGSVAAFREAFGDIRHHQVALLRSVGIAFDHMLSKFAPKTLEEQFQVKGSRSGMIGLGARGRPWQAYIEHYAELLADRDHAYRKLFGEEWARAYEKELQLQKSRAGTGNADHET